MTALAQHEQFAQAIETPMHPYIKLAQDTYPRLEVKDFAWIAKAHLHALLDTYPEGYFTFRLARSGPWRPSIYEELQAGKTHLLMAITDRKCSDERNENVLKVLFIDIRKALLNSDLAVHNFNMNDTPPTPFMEFDVRKCYQFCEQVWPAEL